MQSSDITVTKKSNKLYMKWRNYRDLFFTVFGTIQTSKITVIRSQARYTRFPIRKLHYREDLNLFSITVFVTMQTSYITVTNNQMNYT